MYEVRDCKNLSFLKLRLKKLNNLKGFKQEVFEETVRTLAAGKKLPKERKDYRLTASLKDFRECHLAPDILLVYQIDEGILVLTFVSIGNHSQLFKSQFRTSSHKWSIA